MFRATWNGAVLAESGETVVVEGNQYFPIESVNQGLLAPSTLTTSCSWKGVANYHSVVVDGQVNANAAWFYPAPKAAAKEIAGRVAFWKGVKVESV